MAAFVPSDEGLCAIDRSVRRGLAVGSFLHWSMVTQFEQSNRSSTGYHDDSGFRFPSSFFADE
jgi:hypothetical protein